MERDGTWLVTGASSGVGRALAVAMASAGFPVILAARRADRLDETTQWCGSSATSLVMDLSDMSSVRLGVGKVRDLLAGTSLAGIIHAAGVIDWTSPLTVDGWTRTAQVNAVAPWRLTRWLAPNLGPSSRVLWVAGASMTLPRTRPDWDRWRRSHWGEGPRLALETAAAKVVMARCLAQETGVVSFAFHPGLVKSELAEGLPFPLPLFSCLARPFFSTRSKTGEWAALDPAAPALSGAFLEARRAVSAGPPAAPDDAEWLAQIEESL